MSDPDPAAAGPAPSGPAAPADPVDPAPDGPAPRSRPGRGTVVLAGLAAAGLLAGVTRPVWVSAAALDATGAARAVAVGGAEAAPAVLALALVALAASAATALPSRWVRLVTGPVLVLAGTGAAAGALAVHGDPGGAARGPVAGATGVLGGDVATTVTAWPLLALVPAAAVAATGVLALLVGGRWPRTDRHRSAAVRAAAGADPREDPAAAWDALSRGEDPTGPYPPEDPADPAGRAGPADPDGPGHDRDHGPGHG